MLPCADRDLRDRAVVIVAVVVVAAAAVVVVVQWMIHTFPAGGGGENAELPCADRDHRDRAVQQHCGHRSAWRFCSRISSDLRSRCR